MSETTPAAELRAAARRIRDVAGKATKGPWVSLGNGDRIVRDPDLTPVALDYVVDEPLEANPGNGDHIALWDPIVAELVADLLDNVGKGLEYPSGRAPTPEEEQRSQGVYRREILLARAILGGAS